MAYFSILAITPTTEDWITYPRNVASQARIIRDWRARIEAGGGPARPAMQSLYVDVEEDREAPQLPLHERFRSGIRDLKAYLNIPFQWSCCHIIM
jgi:hypothetical protein